MFQLLASLLCVPICSQKDLIVEKKSDLAYTLCQPVTNLHTAKLKNIICFIIVQILLF